MNLKYIVTGMCATVVMGLSIVTPAVASSGSKHMSVDKAKHSALLRAIPNSPSRGGLRARVPNAHKASKPQAVTAQDVVDFIAMCDANRGGISQEPHPNGVDVILDCSVN